MLKQQETVCVRSCVSDLHTLKVYFRVCACACVGTYAHSCAYVCVCVYVCVRKHHKQPPRYFIGINNRCVCRWQFTQSVCLSHRQTPHCYCLAQRLTWGERQSENDTVREEEERSREKVQTEGTHLGNTETYGGNKNRTRSENEEKDRKNNEKRHCVCFCVRYCQTTLEQGRRW